MRRDADGRALLLTGAQVDIDRRKENEERLRLAASVFSSSYEAILITDADNRIVDVNPAFCRITGYSREESLGRDPGMLASGRQGREFYRAMWQALESTTTGRASCGTGARTAASLPRCCRSAACATRAGG